MLINVCNKIIIEIKKKYLYKHCIYKNMKNYEYSMLFLGSFSPLFLIIYIDYIGFHIDFYFSIIIAFFLFNLLWLKFLNNNEKQKYETIRENYKIIKVKRKDDEITIYFIPYIIIISILFISPVIKGIFLIGMVFIILYIIYKRNTYLIANNVFLAMFGYVEYQAETSSGSLIYVITKNHIYINHFFNLMRIEPFIYYYEEIPDTN